MYLFMYRFIYLSICVCSSLHLPGQYLSIYLIIYIFIHAYPHFKKYICLHWWLEYLYVIEIYKYIYIICYDIYMSTWILMHSVSNSNIHSYSIQRLLFINLCVVPDGLAAITIMSLASLKRGRHRVNDSGAI